MYIYICTYIYLHICMYIYVCIYIYIYVCTYMYIHICIYINIYTYARAVLDSQTHLQKHVYLSLTLLLPSQEYIHA